MKVSHWKDVETAVEEHLSKLQETDRMTYHRFYDTASAGNYLPEQPGDFLIVYKGVPILLECKFSSVHKSLRSCFSNAVSAGQIASSRIWSRAWAETFFLFYSSVTNTAEVWDGLECVSSRKQGTPLRAVNKQVASSVEDAADLIIKTAMMRRTAY